jgi:hypothetical protein
MAVPTVYRWDDLNAPQITNVKDWTQIKAWYQAIFVNGYLEDDNITTKSALGWGVTEDNVNHKITLDMLGDANSENLMRIQMLHNHQVDDGNDGHGVIAWEHQGSNTIVNITGYWGTMLMGSNDDSLKVCPWILIGTSRGFYTLSGYNSSVTAPTLPSAFTNVDGAFRFNYFGNYVNDGVNLARNIQCVLGVTQNDITNASTDLTSATASIYDATSEHVKCKRNYLGNSVAKNLVHREALDEGSIQFIGAPASGLKFPYIDGGLYFKPMTLYNKADGVYYGKLPAMYYPEHTRPLTSSDNLIEFDGSGVYSGHKFIGLGHSTSNEFYINISEDWGI